MDDIFEKNNFLNEIIVNRVKKSDTRANRFNTATDSIFFYSKTNSYVFNGFRKQLEIKKKERWHAMDSQGQGGPRIIFGKEMYPPSGRHWTFNQEKIDQMISEGKIRLNPRTGKPEYRLEPVKTQLLDSNWTDIPGYTFKWEYPTENSEQLLERIIEASSEKDDLVLDAFAGSGTTGAVAEKLGRRWIMIDCGKLAIYTMQKRLLNLREEFGNRGKPLKPKPFTLYNAGLYDYKMVKDLPWEKYREFVLRLFQCRDEPHRIAGVELDGYLGADPVMVFNYKKHKDVILDRGFIDDLHKILGDKVGYKFFIIAPAASVMFFEDYIQKPARGAGKIQTRYFALRIPHSIIDELHRKGFTHIKQPIREADVNDTIDAVGFDFIQIPDVECDYFIEDKKGQMEIDKSNKEAVIKIRNFKSNIFTKKPLKFENRETLSMVMVDYDYNGEVFDFDDVFYAEDLKKNDWEVRFDLSAVAQAGADKIADQMMIIYIDIFGNEKREVKTVENFSGPQLKR